MRVAGPSAVNVRTDSKAFGSSRDSPCSIAMRSGGATSVQRIHSWKSVPSGPCITKSHSPPTRNSKDRVVVVKPSGPHHRDRCRTRVNASNTSSRGAPITREITISLSAVACAGSPPLLIVAIVWSLLPCLLQLLHVLVQPVEALAPEPLEAAHPLVDRPQPAGVQAVEPLLARPADPHEPDLAEDPQVLGRLRLGHPQVPRQVGHGPLAAPQQHQDLPPLRFGDRVERVRGRRRPCHGTIICLYWNVSTPRRPAASQEGLCDE